MVCVRNILAVVCLSALALNCNIARAQFGICQPVHYEVLVPSPRFNTQLIRPDLMTEVRRIAILDVENGTRVRNLDRTVHKQLAGALRTSGRYDVADVSKAFQQPCQMEAVLRSQYPLQILADCWRFYRAEAVLFSRIDEFRSYSPMAIGFTAHIVDAQDAVLIATVNDFWSLGDPEIARDYHSWLRKRYRKCKDLEIYLHSPREFTAFVMDRIAQGLK